MVRDRFNGMVRFKGQLRGIGKIVSVIIDAITEIIYSSSYF